jgi:hypothetical protein
MCRYVLKDEIMRFLFIYGPLVIDVRCIMYLTSSSHDEVFLSLCQERCNMINTWHNLVKDFQNLDHAKASGIEKSLIHV